MGAQNGRFPCKITLHLKKVCHKVSLRENRQRQSCKAFIERLRGVFTTRRYTNSRLPLPFTFTFIGLSIRVEIIGGGRPLKVNFLIKVNHPLSRQQMPAISSETLCVSYLHRNDYNAV